MKRLVLGVVAAVLAAWPSFGAQVASQPVASLEDYGKLPAMELFSLSPSGRRYACIARTDGKQRLVVFSDDGKVLQAQALGTAKVGSIRWAGEDHVLLSASATTSLWNTFLNEKAELGAVVVFDLAHHKTFSVFINPAQDRVANTVMGNYGVRELGGHWYGFFGGLTYDKQVGHLRDDDRGMFRDVYKVDLDTGEFELAALDRDHVREWVIGPDGAIAARLLYDRFSGLWRLLAGASGGRELARGVALTADVEVLGPGKSIDTILVATAGTEHDVVQEIALADGKVKGTYDARDVGEPLYDPNTHLWIGDAIDTDDVQSSKLFADADETKLRGSLKAFPNYSAHLTSYSADFNRMVVYTDAGDDSGTYWLVDIARHSADPLGGQRPSITSAQVGPVRWLDYKAADGLAMRGVLTLPPGRAPKGLPLVVMPHGGPEAHDTVGFDWLAQAFASRGYAVWQPNFRGSDGSTNAFRDAGYGQWGRKMQTDISDGAAELARQGVVDPKRACTVGWSYGGYAALAGVTLQQGLYRCAVSYGGVSDPGEMLAGAKGDGANPAFRFWKRYMGVGLNWGSALDDVTPSKRAARADAPVLLIHGKDDTVVSIEQSQAMDRALRRAGKSVDLIVLPGADHWLLEEPSRIAMLKASMDFVLKYNPPDGAPTSASRAAVQRPPCADPGGPRNRGAGDIRDAQSLVCSVQKPAR